MTTVFPPLCFNFIMPNLRRRVDTAAPPVTTEAEILSRGHIRPSPTLCRNLFGSVDHEESMKFVKRELDRLAKADARRWNFDFVNEKPLEGKIKWQVTDGSRVPPAYNMPNLSAKIAQASTSKQTTEKVASVVTPSDKTIAPIEPAEITASTNIVKPVVYRANVATTTENNKKSIVKSKSVKRKRSQTHITDYLRTCKRSRSSQSSKIEENSSTPVLKRAKTSS